jgi:hypothetical protein
LDFNSILISIVVKETKEDGFGFTRFIEDDEKISKITNQRFIPENMNCDDSLNDRSCYLSPRNSSFQIDNIYTF